MRSSLLILFVTALSSPSAWGAGVPAESAQSSFQNIILPYIGETRGGFSLGVDYEKPQDRTESIGAYLRIYQKNNSRGMDGVNVLGAFIRPHFYSGSWSFEPTLGFGLVMIDPHTDNNPNTSEAHVNALGPMFAVSVMKQVDTKFAFGFEYLSQFIWLNDDRAGLTILDLALKMKVGF